jgi:hypothetical protein
VPPLPVADKLTVAVVFADAGLLKVTLDAVGAVVPAAACLSKKNVSLAVSPPFFPVIGSKRRLPLATVLTTLAPPADISISALLVNIDKSRNLARGAYESYSIPTINV